MYINLWTEYQFCKTVLSLNFSSSYLIIISSLMYFCFLLCSLYWSICPRWMGNSCLVLLVLTFWQREQKLFLLLLCFWSRYIYTFIISNTKGEIPFLFTFFTGFLNGISANFHNISCQSEKVKFVIIIIIFSWRYEIKCYRWKEIKLFPSYSHIA